MVLKMNQELVNKLIKNFSSYKNNYIGKEEIKEFVNQVDKFDISNDEKESVKRGMFKILINVAYLGREEIIKELDSLLSKMYFYEKQKSAIIKYGKEEDSSYRLINYLKKDNYVCDINVALEEDYKTFLFIDDGANSGHQIISIFQEYMGVHINKRATNENHVKELGALEKEKLKTVNIVIGFIYFNEKVKEYIFKEFRKIGLSKIRIIYNKRFETKISNNDNLFDNQEQRKNLICFLEKIGLYLLQSNKLISTTTYKNMWSQKRVRRSALGYNNAQQLVVFEYNIPTYTITALWQTGEIRGIKWKGLFNRRD